MLRALDDLLFEEARDLTAICALQDKVALFIAGSQLVTVAKKAW